MTFPNLVCQSLEEILIQIEYSENKVYLTLKIFFSCSTFQFVVSFFIVLYCFFTLHEKPSFQLKIFSVNVTRSGGNCGFGHIYCRDP